MRPTNHLAVSTLIGGSIWVATKEPASILLTITTGTLVDVDHLLDMIWHNILHRRPTGSFFLHGWEWLISMVVLGTYIGFPWWLVAISLGYASHMISDQIFNRTKLFSYSVIYRSFHRFRLEKVFQQEKMYGASKEFHNEIDHIKGIFAWFLTVVRRHNNNKRDD